MWMYRRILVVLALGGLLPVFAEPKPIALVGDPIEVRAFESKVFRPGGYVCETFPRKWLPPADYARYAAVCLFGPALSVSSSERGDWSDPEARQELGRYLAAGGRLVLGGGVPVRRLLPEPAVQEDERKAFLSQPGVVMVGKPYGRLLSRCRRKRLPLTEPDDNGIPRPTAEGRQVEAVRDEYLRLFASMPDVLRTAAQKRIVPVPLGGHGTLETAKAFKVKPKLGPKAKPSGVGLLLFGEGVKAAVVARDGAADAVCLARECAWHLSEMTGASFDVTNAVPSEGTSIIIGEDPTRKENEVAIVRREGDRVFVSGRGRGVGFALTYLLESLGCRYLWPGTSGKVIPKVTRVVLPAIELDFVPSIGYRRIRNSRPKAGKEPKSSRAQRSFRRLGFDYRAYAAGCNASNRDAPGNRDFFSWHGVDSGRWEKVRWGHYFGDYVERYQKQHPEWFALQPNGTRRVGSERRPYFCLSNDELARETAKNILADFRANPALEAHTLCLPDGGSGKACVCEDCRRLDPTNAPPTVLMTYLDEDGREFPYVSTTDRTLHFMNRVAELVTAEMPGKKLTTYAYSYYRAPPVRIKPHPALIILLVSYDYANADRRDSQLERDFSAWAGFGNSLLWRPNALRGMSPATSVPLNFARYIFRDVSNLKANGVIGVDFDCYDHSWGIRGLAYYMATKAVLNPDELDYETFLSDYLEKGFGPAAAAMRRYFADLEGMLDACAHRKPSGDLRSRESLGRMRLYLSIFDPERLDASLAEAEQSAAGDAMILRRLRMFRLGNEYGRHLKRISAAQAANSPDVLAYERQFLDFMKQHVADPDDLLSVAPANVGYHDWPLREFFDCRQGNKSK